jgi:integrase
VPVTLMASPDEDPEEPNRRNRPARKSPRKTPPKLRDGVIRRGKSWSYVIRVTDPRTGESRPKWVGGYAPEAEAKAARDEARVRARRGEYIDKSRITVREYLNDWLETHAMEIKPKTLEGYRAHVRFYVLPHIGGMRLQAVRPGTLTKLYVHLLATGGKNGRALSIRTVEYVHAILRKAFRDAVLIDGLLPSSPADRAKRPKHHGREPGQIWTPEQFRTFMRVANGHRLYAFFHLAAYTGARRGELLNLRWRDVNLEKAEITFRGSTDVIDGKRVAGTTKGALPGHPIGPDR